MATPSYASREDLIWFLENGIAVNFDCFEQYKKVMDMGGPERVSFRINPGFGSGQFRAITTGGHGSKFGMPLGDAIRAYSTAREHGACSFGLHMMLGSNNLDPEFFGAVAEAAARAALEVSARCSIAFDYIDIGGGFGVPYAEGQEPPLDLERAARLANEAILSAGIPGSPGLVIEPGRYLVAEAGLLIATVTEVKVADRVYVGTDVSMNTLIRIPLYGASHPILFLYRSERDEGEFDVVGQACENTDFTARGGLRMPVPSPGDLMVVGGNCGAMSPPWHPVTTSSQHPRKSCWTAVRGS
ncbi:hypothetical protein [Thermogymnomonas acidicola]|uniref:hypothetical protein n=1 Tax=Thermogymnomonas acidicola TaxID=399579 RepID=UPI0013969B56|nr:hypothetical protein [Thermogymnomonas acidicola]